MDNKKFQEGKWHICFISFSSETKQALYFHFGTLLVIIIWWYFGKSLRYCCATNYHKTK